jgi:hypothetical protein
MIGGQLSIRNPESPAIQPSLMSLGWILRTRLVRVRYFAATKWNGAMKSKTTNIGRRQ